MSTQPIIEKLIEAHLDFLDEQFAQTQVIQQEFEQFYHWLGSRQLQHLWTFEQVQQLIQKQILDTPASDFLIEQIAEHIRFALIHPANDTSTIEDVIPVLTIDRIAQYVASKEEHRKKLIKTIVNRNIHIGEFIIPPCLVLHIIYSLTLQMLNQTQIIIGKAQHQHLLYLA